MLAKIEEEEKKETPRILAFCGHLLLVLLLEHNAIVSDFLIVYQVWALQNLTIYLIFFPQLSPINSFFFPCSFFFFRTYISRARLVKRVRTVSLLSCARIFIPTLFSSLPYFRHTHKRARRAAFLAPQKKKKKAFCSLSCIIVSLSLSSPFLTYSKQCHFEPLHTH